MDPLTGRIACYLKELCAHPDRHPGRPGNRAATELFTRVAKASGLDVAVTELECVDVQRGQTTLLAGADRFEVRAGTYSNSCYVSGPLTVAGSIGELEAGGRTGAFAGGVLLLQGELCREQLRPRGFPFYEMPEHDRILDALEIARPAAVVAATGRNPMSAGAVYPFPLIEDAAVEIPNAYMTDVEGERLSGCVGTPVRLTVENRRLAGLVQHVVARAHGTGSSRIVVFGHIDTKDGTPGALDNATGVAALMGLAWLLVGYAGRHTVELVSLNGEDYYDATGEKRYCAENDGRWDEIVLGLNADAAGRAGRPTEVSLYGCSDAVTDVLRGAIGRRSGFAEGEAWYQGDHGIFLLHERPAAAVTSAGFAELCETVTHTTRDTVELVDPAIVADVARFYADVIDTMA